MDLRRFSNKSVKGWVHPEFRLPDSLTGGWNASPAIPGSELVLDCRGRRIYKAELERSGCSHPCFIHLFRNQSFSRSLQRTHAFHILQVARKMEREGIQTLEVLAALKPRKETLNWHSVLIASEIESVNELPSGGNHVFQVHKSVEFDTSIASTLASELATFHDRKFVHGDLKTRHILAQMNTSTGVSSDGIKRFYLVDLEKSRHYPHLPNPLLDVLVARDLIQLLASLPVDSKCKDLAQARSQFLSEYFSGRDLSKFRISVIQRILDLYSPEGGLRQGRTILESLITQLRKRSSRG